MQEINESNIDAEKKSPEGWQAYRQAYFARAEPIEELWNLFDREEITLPSVINIIDFGGAEGDVGEFFKEKLTIKKLVNLSVTDIRIDHLQENKNQKTMKIYADLRHFHYTNLFDLAIMRSILHYFSLEDQLHVLKIARESLKEKGYLLVQAFIQDPEDIELFYKLNKFVDRNLQLTSLEELLQMFERAGFSRVKNLRQISTWNLHSKDFQVRYGLSNQQVSYLRSIIENTTHTRRFTITDKGFTIPIPYHVFLLQK